MSEELAYVLITALIVVPLLLLVLLLMGALKTAWQLQTALVSLPF